MRARACLCRSCETLDTHTLYCIAIAQSVDRALQINTLHANITHHVQPFYVIIALAGTTALRSVSL